MLQLRIFQPLYYLFPLTLALLVTACATSPDSQKDGVPLAHLPQNKPFGADTKIPSLRPQLALTKDILFKALVAEIAGQRGNINIATNHYLELAKITNDAAVIERATRVAIYAGNNDAAYQAATLWIKVDPLNIDAHQVLAMTALLNDNIDQALQHLNIILNNSDNRIEQKLWMIANLLRRELGQNQVLDLMEKLMTTYMDNVEALYAFAHINAHIGNLNRAQELLKQVLKLEPDNEAATLSYVSLLQKNGEAEEAIKQLEIVLKEKQDDFNLRLAYARLLTDVKRFDEARQQFEIIAVQAPNNVDVLYALGLLYLQAERLDSAEQYFTRLNELNKRVYDSSYYLGRISEQKNELNKALMWYQEVHAGKYHFSANIRQGFIFAEQGSVDKALSHVRAIKKPEQEADYLTLIQVEGDILTDAKRYQEAMGIFNQAIKDNSHPDLLYARAMLAEKMDRLDILEADLKTILAKDPNNTTALNALGYTLADQTDRYEEAYHYINRAYELSPNDFYILDSMGWVLYRLGRLDEAVDFLQKALKLKNDPEVATHLGEVLWIKGDRQAAQNVWEAALNDHPEDDRLLEIIEKFRQ